MQLSSSPSPKETVAKPKELAELETALGLIPGLISTIDANQCSLDDLSAIAELKRQIDVAWIALGQQIRLKLTPLFEDVNDSNHSGAKLKIGEKQIEMSQLLANCLMIFIGNTGKLLTYAQIANALYGDPEKTSKTKSMVNNLIQFLAKSEVNLPIKNVRKTGYRMDNPHELRISSAE